MRMSERAGARTVLYEGRWLRLVQRDQWEFIEHLRSHGVVVIVAATPAGAMVLVEQHRVPLGRSVIELPAGLVEQAESAEHALETAARRELLEETGYAAGRMTKLMSGPYSPGRSGDLYHFFLASDLVRAGEGGGVAHEQESIIVHEVPLAGADAWLDARLREGRLVDPKVFAGLHFLRRAGAV
jgi:ADP-ribose pyrophosphatase